MPDFVMGLGMLVVYIWLNAWLLPRLGVST